MQEIKIYVAADGTEFRDKDECEVYEKEYYKNLVQFKESILFFNGTLKRMDFNSHNSLRELFEYAIYIYIVDEEGLTVTKLLKLEDGLNTPDGLGFWVWTDSGWRQVRDDFQDKLKKLEVENRKLLKIESYAKEILISKEHQNEV